MALLLLPPRPCSDLMLCFQMRVELPGRAGDEASASILGRATMKDGTTGLSLTVSEKAMCSSSCARADWPLGVCSPCVSLCCSSQFMRPSHRLEIP